MIEISKQDWKLFQEKVPVWQEKYMERLVRKYIDFLESDKPASSKFWELEKKIKEDKKNPGVQLELRKSEAVWDIVMMLRDEVIARDDLAGFSAELTATVEDLLAR